MFVSQISMLVMASLMLMLTSHIQAKPATEEEAKSRPRRQVMPWDLVNPQLVYTNCFARPCRADGDCCQGYACTGLRGISRRTVALRSCALSLEGLEDLL